MTKYVNKMIALPLILALLLAFSAPVLVAAAQSLSIEQGCCNHTAGESGDISHVTDHCPFCSVLAFDVTGSLGLQMVQTVTQTQGTVPADPVLSPVQHNIDQPPEHI